MEENKELESLQDSPSSSPTVKGEKITNTDTIAPSHGEGNNIDNKIKVNLSDLGKFTKDTLGYVECICISKRALEDAEYREKAEIILQSNGLYDYYLEQINGKPQFKILSDKNTAQSQHANTHKKGIRAINAAELLAMDIPPIRWLVNGLLPVGLAVLAAPPKYYKSFMALQLSISLATGTRFLDADVAKTGCLYCDLESSKRRPRDRIANMLGDLQPPKNLYIITSDDEPGTLEKDFADELEHQLTEHKDIGFIVIDVFQKIRRTQGRSQSIYDHDYADITAIKRIADKHNAGVMLVHHTRKMRDPTDVFNNISGSTAMLGAADVVWMLSKDHRTGDETTLHITGRDVESRELSVRFNARTFQWEYVGTTEEVQLQKELSEYQDSNLTKTIIKAVELSGGDWTTTASDIKAMSSYYGFPVFDDVRIIGQKINKYEGLLWSADNIKVAYDRKNTERLYTFKRHTCH